MDVIGWLQSSADQIPEWVRWMAAAGFAALEVLGLGPLLPGEVAVLLLGASFDDVVLAVVLVLAVTVGASAGDHVLYALGRRWGPGLRERRIVQRLGVARWDAAVAVVERRGPTAIVATRLVPIVRTLTPLAAGTARVPQVRFTVASLVGSLTWALVWGGSGFLLSSSIAAAQQALGNVTWVVAGGVAAVVAVVVVVRTLRRRGVLARSGLDRLGVAAWAALTVAATGSVLALVAEGGAALDDTTVTVAGVVGAVVTTLAVLLVGRSERDRPRGRPGALGVARWLVVSGALVTAMTVHGLPGSIGVVLVVLIALVELAGRRSRLTVWVFTLAGAAAAADSWPVERVGSAAVFGTLVTVTLFAAVVIATVAAVRLWRDRLTVRALT